MGALLFNAAFGFYVVGLFHSAIAFFSKKDIFVRVAHWSVWIGFAFHTGFLIYRGLEKASFPLTGMRESLAFFAWTVTLCFLIAQFRYRIRALGIFLLPLVAAFMLSTVFIKASPIPDILRSSWVYFHSTFMFLAYGMFFVTFVAGVLYFLQEKELKSKRPRTLYYLLPSLGDLDDLFLKFLIFGFLSMTAGLIVGMIWAEQNWIGEWYRDPKVLLATVTWAIYLLLIYLRLVVGWRGRKAVVISIIGFVWVLFTFLGASFFGGQHKF